MLRVHLIRLCAFSEQHQRICFNREGEKAEESEIKLPTSVELSKKQESFRKTSISVLLTMPKPSTVWITKNYRKLLKDENTRPPYLPLEKSVSRSGSKS